MRLAASTCREQQAIQRRIAKNDPLENRRDIAKAAATAWGKEAVEADKREAREKKRRIELEAGTAEQTPINSAEDVTDAN